MGHSLFGPRPFSQAAKRAMSDRNHLFHVPPPVWTLGCAAAITTVVLWYCGAIIDHLNPSP
ncbi:hypothetical protein BDV32DRAFT_131855 [Aspergillus pseudonomiae]|nr:hypothetical protein BDV32DRAFT_131855 [Aspergillus pseudonomiae]